MSSDMHEVQGYVARGGAPYGVQEPMLPGPAPASRKERRRAQRRERAVERARRHDGGGSRSRGGQYAAVVLVIALSVLGGLALLSSAGDTEPVVVMSGDVARGETIERADLTTRDVAGVDGAVPADDLGSLVGQTAAVDLLSGQILTSGAVTADPVPGPGETLVGLQLSPTQVPDGLEPGDSVRVVPVDSEGAAPTGELDAAAPLVDAAPVYSVSSGGVASGGELLKVTLVVPDDVADQVLTYAAAARLAVAETPAGGR